MLYTVGIFGKCLLERALILSHRLCEVGCGQYLSSPPYLISVSKRSPFAAWCTVSGSWNFNSRWTLNRGPSAQCSERLDTRSQYHILPAISLITFSFRDIKGSYVPFTSHSSLSHLWAINCSYTGYLFQYHVYSLLHWFLLLFHLFIIIDS